MAERLWSSGAGSLGPKRRGRRGLARGLSHLTPLVRAGPLGWVGFRDPYTCLHTPTWTRLLCSPGTGMDGFGHWPEPRSNGRPLAWQGLARPQNLPTNTTPGCFPYSPPLIQTNHMDCPPHPPRPAGFSLPDLLLPLVAQRTPGVPSPKAGGGGEWGRTGRGTEASWGLGEGQPKDNSSHLSRIHSSTFGEHLLCAKGCSGHRAYSREHRVKLCALMELVIQWGRQMVSEIQKWNEPCAGWRGR